MPSTELAVFQSNLGFARQMAATASALQVSLTNAMDVSDFLRSALVQGVSAFDHFVHEEVRARMHQIHVSPSGSWPTAFGKFSVSLATVADALSGGVGWLDGEIREQHGYLSFQHPEKVAGAFKLVSSTPLWPAVAAKLGSDPATTRRRLQLIVDRRNKIAHESDYDPTPPASRYPISRQLVDDALDFLENLASSISGVT